MDNPQLHDILKCPFRLSRSIEAKPGKISCPGCYAVFEIDDRTECIFADTSTIRLPMNGFICRVCGLVQGDQNRACVYCGAGLDISLQ